MPRFLSSMPEMMERGMRGPAVAGRRALALRLGSVAVFVSAWSLASGLVVLAQLFNPIFLPGPWMVIGNIVELAVKGQLWGRLAATLERVALGFGTGAAAALTLGLLAGQIPAIRNLLEPVVELLRPIPPLAMLPQGRAARRPRARTRPSGRGRPGARSSPGGCEWRTWGRSWVSDNDLMPEGRRTP